MNSPSSSGRADPSSVDDAIADYLRLCESGEGIDRDAWLRRFPQWADELRQFAANHGEMEAFAGEMRQRRRSVMATSPLGTEIKYVGEYEILDELGQGGMGIVFKARQSSLDRMVALKMLLDNSRDRNRFRAEAEAAASLDHPNLVTIYEVGDHEGWPYYTMQFVDGHDLGDQLHRPMKPLMIAALVTKLARAVQYAHDRGILHRDLKPANVLIDKLGEPHITDFGLAKFVSDTSQTTNTGTGVVLGTPSYMAPEQAAGDTTQITVGTDVYGLGGVLYALLTGSAPFTGPSGLAVLRKLEREPPAPPSGLRKEVPADLETICLKCLQKLPRDRYGSAKALAADLERFTAGKPIAARPVSVAERTWRWCLRNPAIAVLSAVLLLLLVGSSVGGIWMANSERLAREDAERARLLEAAARTDIEGSVVDAFETNGLIARERRDYAESLLWYATAADMAKTDAQRDMNNVRIAAWNHRVPLPVRAMRFEGSQVSTLEFHPTSRYLLIGDDDGTAYCWDLKRSSGEALAANRRVTASIWSDDGDWLVWGTERGTVTLVDLSTGESRSLGELGGRIKSLAIDGASSTVAAASAQAARLFFLDRDDKSAEDRSAEDRSAEGDVWEPDGEHSIHCATLNSTGTRLAILTDGGRVDVLDVENWPHAAFAPLTHSYQPSSPGRPNAPEPCFTESNKLLLYDNRQVNIVDGKTGSPLHRFTIGDSRLLIVDDKHDRLLNGGDRRARSYNLDGTGRSSASHHRGFVIDADFSPSRDHVVVGSWDRRAYVWRTPMADRRCVLPHQTRVTKVRYSPCGDFIATAQLNGLVRVFRFTDPTQASLRLSVPGGASRGHVFGDKVLFTAGASRTSSIVSLRPLSAVTGQPIGKSVELGGALVDADVDDGGNLAVAIVQRSASESGDEQRMSSVGHQLALCNLNDGMVIKRAILTDAAERVFICGDRFAVLTVGGDLRWFTSDLQAISEPRNGLHGMPPGSAIANPSSSGRLLAVARGTDVAVVDVATGLPCCAVVDHEARVTCVSISDDDQLAASGTSVGEVRVWSVDPAGTIDIRVALPDFVYSVSFSPDSQTMVVAAADGTARLLDIETGSFRAQPMNHVNHVYDAMFTLDGKMIYTIGDNNLFAVWDARDGSAVTRRFAIGGDPKVAPNDRRVWLTRSSDGSRVLVCGKRSRAKLFETELFERGPSPIDTAWQRAALELAALQLVRDAALVSLTTEQWLERWQAFCHKYGTPTLETIDAPAIRF